MGRKDSPYSLRLSGGSGSKTIGYKNGKGSYTLTNHALIEVCNESFQGLKNISTNLLADGRLTKKEYDGFLRTYNTTKNKVSLVYQQEIINIHKAQKPKK